MVVWRAAVRTVLVWHATWSAGEPGQFSLAFRCLADRDDITGRIGEISCPALIVHGTADAAIPLRLAEALRETA